MLQNKWDLFACSAEKGFKKNNEMRSNPDLTVLIQIGPWGAFEKADSGFYNEW